MTIAIISLTAPNRGFKTLFRALKPLKIQRQARLCADQILMHTRPEASGK